MQVKAWSLVSKGYNFEFICDANDYVGKGPSGGIIGIRTDEKSRLAADENIIAGNTLLYGAISGECYINGVVGERFAVRNSGATAVVEGCGDHGCEYMTGGVVVILGKTGRNFAAGMSGGIAYIYDEKNLFSSNCNLTMVELNNLSRTNLNSDVDETKLKTNLLDYDEIRLKHIIQDHVKMTDSLKAKNIIKNWDVIIKKFIKVTPIEYKKVLEKNKNKNFQKVAGE